MNPTQTPALALALAIVAAMAGCRETPSPRPDAQSAGDVVSFAFAGGDGSSARVTITRAPGGGEVLHGETTVAFGANARRCIVEDVTLAPSGRIERASIEVAARCGGPWDQRFTLDAVRGEVVAGSARAVPNDVPWIYAPPLGLATPVSAWVVARAAANSSTLRHVDPAHDHAPLVHRDQVAIDTERGTTVVVGNEGAEVDGTFVERVRMIDYGVTLVRMPKLAEPSAACVGASRGPC